MDAILPIEEKNGHVILLDQTRLPGETVFFEVHSDVEMTDAIKRLAVRGAPAIGIAGAYGLWLGAKASPAAEPEALMRDIDSSYALIASSRPTAVNLFYALDRAKNAACAAMKDGCCAMRIAMLACAGSIAREEEQSCIAIGENALTLLHDGMTLLTHCNAGGLATLRYGTALSPMLLGAQRGIKFNVYADETRPLLQGARLTAFELMRAGVPVTLITDSTAGMLMRQGKIDAVITGSDRIAANGDFANKIGTYSVAVLARHHGIPFYAAAPFSTIDMNTQTGDDIVIEERGAGEITEGFGRRTAPEGVRVYNPAFDVTPAEFASAIITERGILRAPYKESIARAFGGEN